MRNNFWNKRIPSFFGLLFLTISVVALSWMSKDLIDSRGRAAPGVEPKNFQITNVTDTAFTVSYITDDSVPGTIGYASDPKLGKIGLDDRDQQTGTPAPHRMHHITVQQLTPGTKYYFGILSGDTNVLDNGQPYVVTTAGAVTATPSNQAPVVGKVNLPDGNIPLEGIAYVSTDDSQMISVLLKQDGGYVLPVNALRTKDLTTYASISATTVFHLVVSNPTLTSQASVLASQANPVPLITLSKNYDFTISTNPLTPSETGSASAGLTPSPSAGLGFGGFTDQNSSASGTPTISSPKDQQKFSDQQPMFTGTAVPNETVAITIESAAPISTSVQADAQGNWQFRPDAKLAPGQHTITIVTKDINGLLQTIKRSFTVFAAGSQFTEPSISPSPVASPTATPVILPTPTLAPTATPMASPTATLVPTATPTVLPSLSPTLPITPGPTRPVVNQPLPKTGSVSLLLGGILTLLSVGAGALILLVTSGAIPL